MVVRRDKMRASQVMQTRVRNNAKIELLWNRIPVNISGEKGLVTRITLQSTLNQAHEHVDIAGLFYAIGHTPNTAFLDGQLEVDAAGYLITEPGSTRTAMAGVFAAGDVQDKVYRQAITSAGTGCMAALDVEKYLAE